MSARTPHPDRPCLFTWDIHVPHSPDDGRPAVAAWAAHVEAGRIGEAAGSSPEQAARRERMEALAGVRGRLPVW